MWVVAHRGAETQELENTLAAFRKAVELGADAVEMDVHATFDNEVVVLHDPTAARVAAEGSPFAEAPVAGLRLEQVRRIRLRNGEGIPTLAEVAAATELPMQVEVKSAGAVVALQSFFQKHPEVLERVLLICFHDLVLVELAARIPGCRLGVLRGKDNPADLQVLDHLPAENLAAFLPAVAALDAETISRARERGARIGCWTVRDSTDLERAVAAGVDFVTVGEPGIVDKRLRSAELLRW